jgi:hypothetical protein
MWHGSSNTLERTKLAFFAAIIHASRYSYSLSRFAILLRNATRDLSISKFLLAAAFFAF